MYAAIMKNVEPINGIKAGTHVVVFVGFLISRRREGETTVTTRLSDFVAELPKDFARVFLIRQFVEKERKREEKITSHERGRERERERWCTYKLFPLNHKSSSD